MNLEGMEGFEEFAAGFTGAECFMNAATKAAYIRIVRTKTMVKAFMCGGSAGSERYFA